MNFGGAVDGGLLDERDDEIYGSRSAGSTPQTGTQS